uniref:MFS-type transporter ppz2 n=1 Tax=Metarhizium majus (strain ARSEF 297) TaxID=1276143 RepID=PPZ2_METMF|nr:TPA_exp: MFS transporter [Metarhizium majus ARSEF 297]
MQTATALEDSANAPSPAASSQGQFDREIVPIDTADAGNSTKRSPLKVALIMVALCCAVFLHALDNTIITTALPTITAAFDLDAAYTWIGSTYLLAVAASTMVWAKISDVFGRKPIILSANLCFFTGSLIAALSANFAMLIAARAIQGIGGAGVNVLANICVGDLFSQRKRGLYYGVIGGVWAVALSLGPVVGGSLTESISWRWCFYINLPLCAVVFVIIILLLDVKTPKTPFGKGIAAIDWVGAALSIGSTLMILLALSLGGQTEPWNSATVICLVVFGFIGWILCFSWEASLAKYPLLPVSIFKQIPTLAVLAACFIQSYAFVASAYYLPLYFQAVLGATPILSGVYLLPTAVSISISSTATGVYMRKTGQYLTPIYIGFVLQTLGYGLFIDLGPTANWAKIIVFQIIGGLGVGFNFQAPMVALQAFISPRELAMATSAYNFMRNVSGAISVVIGQTVFQNEMSKHQESLATILGPQLAAKLAGTGASASTDLIRSLPSPQRDVVHGVFANSMKSMWIMYTAFSAAALVVCPFLGKMVLREDHTETVTGLAAENAAREERLRQEKEKKDAKIRKCQVN